MQVTWSSKTEIPLSTLKSHLLHVLFASINRNCEIRIKLVSRVQIPVEASLEKFFTSKIEIYPQQTACKSDMRTLPKN